LKLWEANQELTEGLDVDQACTTGTKDHIRRRQLQAKMAVQMLEFDMEKGTECLRLWKEMNATFVHIRSKDFKTLDEYLSLRAVDAGCP
jgi:ophiobolin F synthase